MSFPLNSGVTSFSSVMDIVIVPFEDKPYSSVILQINHTADCSQMNKNIVSVYIEILVVNI